jgi:hypothetical protein
LELEDLEAAKAAAERRIVEVQQAASTEAERERAAKAEPILKRLEARGKVMDSALASYCAAHNGIWDDVAELMALDCPITTRNLIRVNLHRSHDAALSVLGGKHVRLVPPNQRFSFDKLTRSWAQAGLNWIASKLNTNTARDAA